MQAVYPPMFIHLDSDRLYAAEHIAVILEHKGLLDDRFGNNVKKGRKNAFNAIRNYLRANLTPDGQTAIDAHRNVDVYAGAKIIERAGVAHLGEDQLEKYKTACQQAERLRQEPMSIKSYLVAFTPETYLDAVLALDSRKISSQTDETGISSELPIQKVDNQMSLPLRRRRFPKRKLLLIACLFMCTSVIGAVIVHHYFGNITEIRRAHGVSEADRALGLYNIISEEADEVITKIGDEKKLYRYAENEMLSGNMNLSEEIFRYILLSTEDQMLAMFTRFKLAEVFLFKGNFSFAREMLHVVIDEIDGTPFAWYRPSMMHLLAGTYILTGEPEAIDTGLMVLSKADEYIETTIQNQGFQSTDQEYGMREVVSNMRSIALLLKADYGNCIRQTELAFDYAKKRNDQYGQTEALITRALAYHFNGSFAERRRCVRAISNYSNTHDETRFDAFLAVLHRHIDRCDGIKEDLTDRFIENYTTETGDALPLIIERLIANVPCPERTD